MSERRGRGVDTDHVGATGKHFLSQAGCAERQTAICRALQAPMGALDQTTQNILTCLLLQAPTAQGIIFSSLWLTNLIRSLASWAARENRMEVVDLTPLAHQQDNENSFLLVLIKDFNETTVS